MLWIELSVRYGVCTLAVMAPPPPSTSTELLVSSVSFSYAGPGVILYLCLWPPNVSPYRSVWAMPMSPHRPENDKIMQLP